jgi:hypothetical protein
MAVSKGLLVRLCRLFIAGLTLAAINPAFGVEFPLRVGATNRYVVDRSGEPFLIRGDSPWSLITALNLAEVEQYLNAREARGFNTILVNLIEHKFNGSANQNLGRFSPMNRQGDVPFLTAGDFSTPNKAYFAFADKVIDQAPGMNYNKSS